MTPVAGAILRSKGHPRGGLFFAWLLLAACGPPTSGVDLGPGPGPGYEPLPDPLRAYRQLGFLTGDQRFAAVGRFVYTPGPGDSTYAILALSLPNTALRFRREPPGFVARYRVDVSVGDSAAPVARLSQVEEVRIRTFRETSRRDESVIFQGLLTLPPGAHRARLQVRDIGSGAGFTSEQELRVPGFAAPAVTAPILVYRAQARETRDVPPTFILSPRATVALSRGEAQVYVERLSAGDEAVVLDLEVAGQPVWSDTLVAPAAERRLRSLTTRVAEPLPPGAVSLRARLQGTEAADSTTLVVALASGWLAVDYEEALSYLRYAGTPETLDSLRHAPPRERARLLHAFWERRDPDPETVENEFFERYLRRLREANARFGELATAGWLTDRGAVYVTLGPPDEVLRDLEARRGPERSQVWLYREPLGLELRLVFTDSSGTGEFSLTSDSRRAFAEAVEALYP